MANRTGLTARLIAFLGLFPQRSEAPKASAGNLAHLPCHQLRDLGLHDRL